MTFILSINSPDSIWLLADRRLSVLGRLPKDNARKILILETTDGVALLGYAGLGATARGTEPSDWMSRVLRGRNLPLEASLGVLTEALKREFPQHLRQIRGANVFPHTILVTAFVNNEVRAYSIDLVVDSNSQTAFRYTRYFIPKTMKHTPPLGIGGSGLYILAKNRKWIRPLLRLVKAYNKKQVSSNVIADHLASINSEVAKNDNSVSTECIVVWRNRKGSQHKPVGGGHQFYKDKTRIDDNSSIPLIGNGMDINALVESIMPRFIKDLDDLKSGKSPKEWDKDEVNKELALLPDKPDETLR